MLTALTEPFMLRAYAIMLGVGILTGFCACGLRRALDRAEPFSSPQRQLRDAYARFHLFLLSVQLAALGRRVR
jgi:hypothetical protein